MAADDMILVAAAVLCACLLFQPRLLHSPLGRATVTPLASIIGSGFLVAGPILAHVAGHWAWLAMLALCALGYLFGAAIRHNIAWVEPQLAEHPGRRAAVFAIGVPWPWRSFPSRLPLQLDSGPLIHPEVQLTR